MGSFELLAKIVSWYRGYCKGKDIQKPVAYLSGFSPVEILRAMDIVCLYPENIAAVYAASGKAKDKILISSKEKYSKSLCGYARAYMGSLLEEKNSRKLPVSDFMVGTNNQCGTIHPWFEIMGKDYQRPVFLIDYPPMNSQVSGVNSYIHSQHLALIDFVKKITGHEFDESKYKETLKYSREATYYWKKNYELGKENPSKIKAADLFNEMMPLVVARGTKLAADYYKALYEEKKSVSLEGHKDKLRLFWYGYPFWFLKGYLPSLVTSYCVANNYIRWWNLDYGESSNLEELSKTYSNMGLNYSFEERFSDLISTIKDYSIDGVLIHNNLSCKRDGTGLSWVKKELHNLNIPSLVLDGDMMDENAYSKNITKTKIEIFLETLN